MATKNRVKLANFVRTEVLNQLDLNENSLSILTNDKFSKPMGDLPIAKYVKGKLIGENPELARKGNEYPYFTWNSEIKKCDILAEGEVNVQFNENLTAELGEGIELQATSFEAWKN